MIGSVVHITGYGVDRTVGVIVSVRDTIARVLIWKPKVWRWSAPFEFELERLPSAPIDWPQSIAARENIRRHHGLVPCGGTQMRYVRVWPDGKEPVSS